MPAHHLSEASSVHPGGVYFLAALLDDHLSHSPIRAHLEVQFDFGDLGEEVRFRGREKLELRLAWQLSEQVASLGSDGEQHARLDLVAAGVFLKDCRVDLHSLYSVHLPGHVVLHAVCDSRQPAGNILRDRILDVVQHNDVKLGSRVVDGEGHEAVALAAVFSQRVRRGNCEKNLHAQNQD